MAIIKSYRIDRAEKEIKAKFGQAALVREKNESVIVQGRNENLNTDEETVWSYGGIEVYAVGNDINSISSSDAGDDQVVTLEGHTLVNGVLVFTRQSATLNGQNTVTLQTPLHRITRLYNVDSSDIIGDVYVYVAGGAVVGGVPQVAADVHLSTTISTNQSLKCSTSVSNDNYFIITGVTAAVDRQQTRSVDFRLKVREQGSVFRTRLSISVSSNASSFHIPLDPCLIIPPNSDLRMDAASTGPSTGVESTIQGYLARIV